MDISNDLNNAIKIVDAKRRKTKIRRRVRAIIFLLSLTVAPQILGLMLAIGSGDNAAYEVVAWMQLFICLPAFVVWCLLKMKASLLAESPMAWDCLPRRASELCGNGFYELALIEYDKILDDMFEAAKKHEEELARFFEEYHAQTRFVNGLPRPMPEFENHDIDTFDAIISCRIKCLVKLGREEEAKVAITQRNAIETIQNEGKQLTEKYWTIEEDFD